MMIKTDTIVALASPPGVGAISIIRVGGSEARENVRKLLPGNHGEEVFEPRRSYLRKLHDGIFLDQVLLIFFPAPQSYTGEDVVEIYCHGGEVISQRIISALLRHGCRLAQPGEFTRRAVENDKMDLLQAEAIRDLIASESPAAADNALRQLDGELSSKVLSLREQLIKIAALIELELDFSEEDVAFADRREVEERLRDISERIQNLVASYEKGRGLQRGLRVAIVGKPNVGKSSLLNAILGTDRAIVSSQPGTTRDFIEEVAQIGDLRFRFIDTAGIRHSTEEIEKEGIARTKRRIHDADILLFVIDASSPIDELDEEILKECKSACEADPSKKSVLVRNKTDIGRAANTEKGLRMEAEASVSAIKNEGIDSLLKMISKIARQYFLLEQRDVVITNLRQKEALEKSLGFVELARQSSRTRLSGEFITRDLRGAADELAGLLGVITSDQVLDELFANFCIGK
jgi:tRNA modification GTPase